MPGPDPDIEAIFSAARAKRSARERAAYLDRACGDDYVLRERVEALLEADAEAGSFLSSENRADGGSHVEELIEPDREEGTSSRDGDAGIGEE